MRRFSVCVLSELFCTHAAGGVVLFDGFDWTGVESSPSPAIYLTHPSLHVLSSSLQSFFCHLHSRGLSTAGHGPSVLSNLKSPVVLSKVEQVCFALTGGILH